MDIVTGRIVIVFYPNLSTLSSPQLLIMTCAHSFPSWKCPREGNNWPIWPAAATTHCTLHTGEKQDSHVLLPSQLPTWPHYPDQQCTLVKVQNIQFKDTTQSVQCTLCISIGKGISYSWNCLLRQVVEFDLHSANIHNLEISACRYHMYIHLKWNFLENFHIEAPPYCSVLC